MFKLFFGSFRLRIYIIKIIFTFFNVATKIFNYMCDLDL